MARYKIRRLYGWGRWWWYWVAGKNYHSLAHAIKAKRRLIQLDKERKNNG